jgi:FkbM family methyltransferase
MTVQRRSVLAALVALFVAIPIAAQEKSVRPGINDRFKDPNVEEFVGIFEGESREVFAKRHDVVKACGIEPGMTVADIGAGTGLFTRLFAAEVGPKGKVYAVDIAPAFIEHIEKTCKEHGIKNVVGVVCTDKSVELPPRSVDIAFICDTYHHFEYPYKTMASLRRALKPSGRVVVVDFRKIEGVTREWVMNHVRAGQQTVTKEIVSSGFRVVGASDFLKENYLVRFTPTGKPKTEGGKPAPQ